MPGNGAAERLFISTEQEANLRWVESSITSFDAITEGVNARSGNIIYRSLGIF